MIIVSLFPKKIHVYIWSKTKHWFGYIFNTRWLLYTVYQQQYCSAYNTDCHLCTELTQLLVNNSVTFYLQVEQPCIIRSPGTHVTFPVWWNMSHFLFGETCHISYLVKHVTFPVWWHMYISFYLAPLFNKCPLLYQQIFFCIQIFRPAPLGINNALNYYLTCTVDDSGVGQRQLNGTASKTTLQLSECDANELVTSL